MVKFKNQNPYNSSTKKEEDMNNMEPVPIKSPLKGEWMVLNSPGTKIPSHGTHSFATTYAYDLMQVDWTKKPV